MWHFISLQPTHSYCRRFPTHSANYYGSVYVKLKKSLLKKRTKIFVTRQVESTSSRNRQFTFLISRSFLVSVFVRFEHHNSRKIFESSQQKKSMFMHLFFNLDEKLNKINDLQNKLFFDNVLLYKKRNKNSDLVQTVTKKLQ